MKTVKVTCSHTETRPVQALSSNWLNTFFFADISSVNRVEILALLKSMTKLLTSTGSECSLKNLSQIRKVLLCSRNFKNATSYVADCCKLWGIYIKKNVCKMCFAEACRSAQHAAVPFIVIRHFEIICSQQISESFNLKRQICPTIEFMESCIPHARVYKKLVVSSALLRTSQGNVCVLLIHCAKPEFSFFS